MVRSVVKGLLHKCSFCFLLFRHGKRRVKFFECLPEIKLKKRVPFEYVVEVMEGSNLGSQWFCLGTVQTFVTYYPHIYYHELKMFV
ncbi:hypothetical protein BDF20DRAFT_886489 [Mycotypha africana]|uniref:uncharacterized protein n=1 Tax=Mycotypha africana TaxID=64632 RepID=UPI002301F3E2|nr:uncharacterized protein BDF20DRAFT_886489 [Mycotypha africana]KAI8971794.1 hypothetical protein BDF20DRAFT_886489 [Mycotypha africana]